ncbi:MAG TPA: NAD(P)/FAD-dependent oxidoreductase [Dermatophilaceae bacterium]|nr:NAD(P)/FAD-dependent oxidoreductase [Dermatophilaceae bacterium]
MGYDDIVLGGGHNALTAAAYLARSGRRVLVLERADDVGGAAVSSVAFPGVDARLSRYSYLVSLLPARIRRDLDLDVRLVRRRVASYTPVGARGLLVTDDPTATARSFAELTGSPVAWRRWQQFHARMGRLAQRVFPTLLEPLRSADQVRDLVADDELWTGLVERPLGHLLRYWFDDDTVCGVVGTDGLIGTFADLDDAQLRQNVCFLYHLIGGGTGHWDVPVGGMGAVSSALAKAATRAGAEIRCRAEVVAVGTDGTVTWRESGHERTDSAPSLLCGFAPAVLDRLLAATGAAPVSSEPAPEGSQLKVNLLLGRLPALRDTGVDPREAFAGTVHVHEGARELGRAVVAASSGRLPDPLPLEVYCHTLADRSVLGPSLPAQAQTLTLFGLHTPARLFDPGGVTRQQALAAALRSLDSVLAEPVGPLLLRDPAGRPCVEARTPLDLQADLGLPGGNIFHRSLQWPWAQTPAEVGRWGVTTPHPGLLICGAGARRGGGVSGIPGHNAAREVLGR